MSGYLLNISVDTPDGNPFGSSEDLSINDQESLIELVIEQLLGFENAIAEYEDLGDDNQDKKKATKSLLFPLPIVAEESVFFKLILSDRYLIINQLFYPEEFTEINSPPPKS